MEFSPDLEMLCLVLRAACRIDDAVSGTIHLISEDGCTLAAEHDLSEAFADAFRSVDEGDGTTISQACTELRRVVVRDVRVDPSFAPYREVAAEAGIVAVQSTPLNCDETRMHGVLTTYFSRPHHPGPVSLQRLDLCASIAVKIIVASELAQSIRTKRSHAGPKPDVARAASAVQMLLPAIERQPTSELLMATDRKLSVIIEELKERAPELPAPESTASKETLHCDVR